MYSYEGRHELVARHEARYTIIIYKSLSGRACLVSSVVSCSLSLFHLGVRSIVMEARLMKLEEGSRIPLFSLSAQEKASSVQGLDSGQFLN